MMEKFGITLKDEVYYEVEAEDEEEALQTALEWWDMRMPNHTISRRPRCEEVAEAFSHLRDKIVMDGIPNSAEALDALDGVWDVFQGFLDEFDIVL